ncbi:MAG: hypothetical protein HPY69_19540 [Armatimonadetes bacterium]|nr:hypothetical protein [Armatimonadota bacterium]
MDTARHEVEFVVQPVHRAVVRGLQPGRVYRVDVIDPTSGVLLDAGLCSPQRLIPPSPSDHHVDGAFSQGVTYPEWDEVQPVTGRYSHLYADFDGRWLHILNDWYLCREYLNERDFNKFQLSTWPADSSQERLDWLIKVFADGHIEVKLGDYDAEEFGVSAYDHGTSPLVPGEDHSIYELSIDVAEAHRRLGQEPSARGWDWKMEWLDPLVASRNAEAASRTSDFSLPLDAITDCGDVPTYPEGLIREPTHLSGQLLAGGGLTVTAHWRSCSTGVGRVRRRLTIRCVGDAAQVCVRGVPADTSPLLCRVSEWTRPSEIVRTDTTGTRDGHRLYRDSGFDLLKGSAEANAPVQETSPRETSMTNKWKAIAPWIDMSGATSPPPVQTGLEPPERYSLPFHSTCWGNQDRKLGYSKDSPSDNMICN